MSALYIHITDGVEGFTEYPECVMYYVIRLTESRRLTEHTEVAIIGGP